MTTIIEQAQQAELALAAGLAFRIRELAHDIHAVVDALINSIQAAGASVISSSKRNCVAQRGYDRYLYKDRNLVGRFFTEPSNSDESSHVMGNWRVTTCHFLTLSALTLGHLIVARPWSDYEHSCAIRG